MDSTEHSRLNLRVGHLVRLGWCYTKFECQEMLVWNLLRLLQNLSPAVLTTRLGPEHHQVPASFGCSLVFLDAGKQEVRSIVAFRFRTTIERRVAGAEDCLCIVLQRMTYPRFPAIMDADRVIHESIHIDPVLGDEAFLRAFRHDLVLNKATEKGFLVPQPSQAGSVALGSSSGLTHNIHLNLAVRYR